MAARNRRRAVSFRGAALFGAVLFVAAAATLLPLGPNGSGLHAGDRAPRALEASHDAQYESVVQTNEARDEAAAKVADQYLPPDPAIARTQAAKLQALLDAFRTLRQRSDLSTPQQLDEASRIPGATPALSAPVQLSILTFSQTVFDDFAARAIAGVSRVMETAVQPGKIDARVTDYVTANRPDAAAEVAPLRDVLRAFVAENASVDQDGTRKKRDEARAAISPVIVSYTHGQLIASEGKVLSAADIEALRQTGVLQEGWDRARLVAGLIVAAGVAILLATYVWALPVLPPAGLRLGLTALATAAVLVTARAALPSLMPDRDGHYLAYALPLSGAAIVTAVAAGLPLATLVAGVTGLLVAYVGASYPDLTGAGFVGSVESLQLAASVAFGGLAGALAVGRGDRWYRWPAAALASGAAVAAVLGFSWLVTEPRQNEDAAWLGSVAAVQGLGAAAAAALLLGVGGRRLSAASPSRLLRLVQPSQPLLRRLLEEAPGTYHHSVAVATLAERAAARIGADALLARAGATYHDIGKLGHPAYFIENMLDGAPSPHDLLPPQESARLIRDHVSEGLRLAEIHHLPAPVRAFIPEHHGDRLVTYFYRRAANSDAGVDPAPYRYDGARPHSRETAIVMLADSCEAAARARQGPDLSVDALVDEIVAERIAEGQFDDCDLSMRDLRDVAVSIGETLRGMYHPRIAYPNPLPEELARLASSRG